jgi:hypothetical protein
MFELIEALSLRTDHLGFTIQRCGKVQEIRVIQDKAIHRGRNDERGATKCISNTLCLLFTLPLMMDQRSFEDVLFHLISLNINRY